MTDECSICETEFDEQNDVVTTDCNHTFHYVCAQKRVDERQRTDCPYCHKESMLGDALAKAIISSDGECGICEEQWTTEDDIVTTKCGHTYHFACAEKRFQLRGRTDCPYCHQPSTLGYAIQLKNSTRRGECSICETEWDWKSEVITTVCKHTFHRQCAQDRIQRSKKTDCHMCHQESALADVLVLINSTINAKSQEVRPYAENEIENEWECVNCFSVNKLSMTRCAFCTKPRRIAPFRSVSFRDSRQDEESSEYKKRPISSRPSSIDNPYISLQRKVSEPTEADKPPLINSYPESRKSFRSNMSGPKSTSLSTLQKGTAIDENDDSFKEKIVVYLPDLPASIQDDNALHSMINDRLQISYDIKPLSIQCYSKLGFGYLHVRSEEIKSFLVNTIKKVTLDVSGKTHVISFSDYLDIVSYAVVEAPSGKDNVELPKIQDLRNQWVEFYKSKEPPCIDQVDVQFPNIFRIISSSVEDLLAAAKKADFLFNSLFIHIYIGATCSYFENLPKSVTKEQLEQAICAKIGLKTISRTSVHIELNKRINSACIIASNEARIWSTESFVVLKDKAISKKQNLTCHLKISPIPHVDDDEEVVNASIFQGTASIIEHIRENLVLEISDTKIFNECIKTGVLWLHDKYRLKMEAFSPFENPENNELDQEIWYKTEMIRYQPDIMQFIADLNHPIFLYKWNAQVWLSEFRKTKSRLQRTISEAKYQSTLTPDQIRHLLQVTVMLNTIGVIRKKSYTINNRQFTLKLDSELKTILYRSQSLLESSHSLKKQSIPYARTKVVVVNEDCVHTYAKYTKQCKKPLLLNMAAYANPGGGYRKGDGAQEENLFRRSDYFRSLDADLDSIEQPVPARFYCSHDGQILPLLTATSMYPMEEFSAIYTSGLTFFRKSENEGYEFMEEPLEGVHAIAVAAYRNPKLDGDSLTPKVAVNMRKKIEILFSIALHQGHDCLILSALGCGAFRNPPKHVAKLFRSVIEQYAGFFETIVFAIIDDHNSGQQHNPDGNLQAFQNELDGLICEPTVSFNSPNTCMGPYRIISTDSTISDIVICRKPPCKYGAKCNQIYQSAHTTEYLHPPLCAEQCRTKQCTRKNDSIHMYFFVHQTPCKYGAQCKDIDEEQHSQEYEHPSYCPKREKCNDTSDEHERAFRHLPMCKQSKRCISYQKHEPTHCRQYRHCNLRCTDGIHCTKFHNATHMETYDHPFPTPCQLTPYHCTFHEQSTLAKDQELLSNEIQHHCLHYSHVCEFGRICKKDSPLHWEKYIHVPRYMCKYDQDCKQLTEEDHLNSFTHSNIRDIRFLCQYADQCKYRHDCKHTSKYRHVIKLVDSAIVPFFNLNEKINFVRNHHDNIARVQQYIENEKWEPLTCGSIPIEILDWIRHVHPVHRCKPAIFESILLHGHVMSRDYMEQLRKPTFVAASVFQHSRLKRIKNLKQKNCEKHVKKFIEALVQEEFEKVLPNDQTIENAVKGHDTALIKNPLDRASIPPVSTDTSELSDRQQALKKVRIRLNGYFTEKDVKEIETTAVEVAQASVHIANNPTGIGYPVDQKLGTNRNVFAVLGPHLGHYYGDIFIVFKREILHHPDTNFSIQSATSYASSRYLQWRPWLEINKSSSEDYGIELFHKSKLHPSVPGYEDAVALELIALTSLQLKMKSMNVSLSQILQSWFGRDSHQNIEAHLPQLIPLDYIKHIYMTQNTFDSLNTNARSFLRHFFADRITTTKHIIDLDRAVEIFKPTLEDKARKEYQDSVVKDILAKDKQASTQSKSRKAMQGTMITIAGTDFEDPYVMPLTISQAYKQYKTYHNKVLPDVTVYIYWQIMNGDMVLTLSNEQINTSEEQPNIYCLTCYIAEKPLTINSRYHERPSYLHCGRSFQDGIDVEESKYAAQSTSFFLGCNTDDFMTFCLEIERSTGTVSLYHAGPNSIYNHEKISAKFSKQNIDLNQLNYIHVCAGAHTVPIRNLIIAFEKQEYFHPNVDKSFKRFPSTPMVTASANCGQDLTNDSVASSKESENDEKKTSTILDNVVGLGKMVKNLLFTDTTPSLPPCRDSIYCLLQYADKAMTHNSKYSHPCRFSELCRNSEPHLTHKPHEAVPCPSQSQCKDMCDPVHRAKYRHKGWPDFLIPCRDQTRCRNNSEAHRIKYFHEETILDFVRTNKWKNLPKTPSIDKPQRKPLS